MGFSLSQLIQGLLFFLHNSEEYKVVCCFKPNYLNRLSSQNGRMSKEINVQGLQRFVFIYYFHSSVLCPPLSNYTVKVRASALFLIIYLAELHIV